MHIHRLVTLTIAGVALASGMIAPRNAAAASTIDAHHSFAWAGNFGWMNWLPSPADGVSVDANYCSGYIYAANVGWISMGSGPKNGSAYSNTGASDYGVNSNAGAPGEKALRGFAWGANIGWLNFESTGNPRVILSTGQLRGYVWSANCGWINFDDANIYVQTAPGPLATPTPTPTATPNPTATATPTPSPDPSATPISSPTPTPAPTSTPSPSATPKPSPSANPVSHLANISTRLRVGSGDDVLIAGVIVQGSGSKKVVVRGIGPSLPLTNTLSDPSLALYDGSNTLIATNDDWFSDPNAAEVFLSGLSPQNPKESALVGALQPTLYTVVLRGADGGTGNAIVELYDLETNGSSEIVNISTRGFVDTADNVMIGGFIITGNNPLTVLIRGIGPSLTAANVPNVLSNPELELHNGNGDIIYFDDNWRDTQEAALVAVGLQPTNDAEAAIIVSLLPGNYTAIVRGADGGVGNGLLEVYKLSQ